jgi:hypothetical protein
MLRFDLPDADQVELFRAMSPAQRVQAGLDAAELVILRLRAHYMSLHPDWSGEEIQAAVTRRMLRDRS